jgi:DNA polymerase I-like protein with 3'-5' exonuclease and polymerase domains
MVKILAMKIGQDYKELTNVEVLIKAIWSNPSLAIDIETFYKKDYTVPFKKGKKPKKGCNVTLQEPEIDWSELTPETGEIRSIQTYLPKQDISFLITGDNLDPSHPLIAAILDYVQDTTKRTVIHNFLYEGEWLLSKYRTPILNGFCTMVASQVESAGLQYFISSKYGGANSLGVAVRRHLGVIIDKSQQTSNWGTNDLTKEQIEYALLDPFWCYSLYTALIKKPQVTSAAGNAEQLCLPVFAHLNHYGIPADIGRLRALEKGYKDAAEVLGNRLLSTAYQHINSQPGLRETLIPKSYSAKKRATWELNLNSTNQLKGLLNSILRSEGKPEVTSTKAAILEQLNTDFTKDLCKYRSMVKLGQYAEGFIRAYDANTGRVKGKYSSLAAQATGRSACKKPSLQIVSNASPLTKLFNLLGLKSAFVFTRNGKVGIKCDLRASHAAIATWVSQDKVLLESMLNDEKLHYHTMVKILELMGLPHTFQQVKGIIEKTIKVDNLEWYKSLYTRAKNAFYSYLNFAGSKSLQMTFATKGTHATIDECSQFLKACRTQFNGLFDYQKRTAQDAERSIQKRFDFVTTDRGVLSKTAVYGTVAAPQTPVFIGNVSVINVPDGRVISQPAIKKKDEYLDFLNYLNQDSDELVIWTSRASQVVSSIWLGIEATIIKTAMRRVYDLFRARSEWQAEIIAFAHDEILCHCKLEYADPVKAAIDEIIADEFKKFCPPYYNDPFPSMADWESEFVLKQPDKVLTAV